MLIDVISDIHLDYPSRYGIVDLLTLAIALPNININPSKDKVLVMAGDLGHPISFNYQSFLRDCSYRYKYVVYVAGNHEYYNLPGFTISMVEIKNIIKAIVSSLSNVYFLDCGSIILDGVRFIGMTLWTNIPKHLHDKLLPLMTESTKVYYHYSNNVTPQYLSSIHHQEVQWLLTELSSDQITPTIIVSHHLPSDKLIHPRYTQLVDEKSKIIQHAFVTNLEYIRQGNLIGWIAGHTHSTMWTYIDKVLYLVNPLGASKENIGFRVVTLKC
jgi:hypothetical protein